MVIAIIMVIIIVIVIIMTLSGLDQQIPAVGAARRLGGRCQSESVKAQDKGDLRYD